MVDYNKSPLATGVPVSGWNPTGQSFHYTTDTGGAVQDDHGYDADVDRLRARGAQFGHAPVLDPAQANESRAMQMGALGYLHNQATGAAPSAAEIMSQRANEAAAMNGASQVSAARTAGAGIVAAGNAGAVNAGQAMAANAHNADMRAGEISRGQGSFAAGAAGMNRQDIAQAVTNAQLEQQQRALNEQHQQANEQLAWDTRNQGMQNAGAYSDLQRNNWNAQRQREDAKDAQNKKIVTDTASTVTGGIMGSMHSDERSKMHVMPIGSLAQFMRDR